MLSQHHKVIFVHIPKCAGQSVEIAFLSDLGLSWETRAPLLLRFNDNSKLGPPRLAHLLAKDYYNFDYVSRDVFDQYFKFAIVRNPWSRAVSLYKHLDHNISFKNFVSGWLSKQFELAEQSKEYWFVRPQADFVYDDEKLLVGEILRFESLREEFDRIIKPTNLKTPLPHVNKNYEMANNRRAGKAKNKSERGRGISFLNPVTSAIKSMFHTEHRDHNDNWREFYDDESRAIVAKLYERDVQLFNYSFQDA